MLSRTLLVAAPLLFPAFLSLAAWQFGGQDGRGEKARASASAASYSIQMAARTDVRPQSLRDGNERTRPGKQDGRTSCKEKKAGDSPTAAPARAT